MHKNLYVLSTKDMLSLYTNESLNLNFFQIPQFDNLYLDMNSIIHKCAHPNNADVYFRVGKKEFSDEELFQNISRYVELIFYAVKPTKVMFLAFDGVAPRAKINQQRAVRFRTVNKMNCETQESEQLSNDLFDGNCVTPGTTFMNELIKYLKNFIARKISKKSAWQEVKIILSGSEVCITTLFVFNL